MQSSKENLLIARHVIKEFFCKGNLDLYEDFIAEGVQVHVYLVGKTFICLKYLMLRIQKKLIKPMRKPFNLICVRWGGEGIHKGDFFSIPATHRPFELSGQTLYRLNEEDKIEEVWQS